jgi:O-methyltransferase
LERLPEACSFAVTVHNIFLTELFDWKPNEPSRGLRIFNKILAKLRFPLRVYPPRYSGMMTNIEQRMNMYHLASQVLVYGVEGDFVELGCNAGQSAVLFRKLMDHYDPSRALHVYDSFEGLPEPKSEDGDTPFFGGQMAVAEEALLANFRRAGVEAPTIHRGWFDDSLPGGLPERIAFAHLDGDLYESILVSLEHVSPRLSRGAVCLVDDYADPAIYDGWNYLPGVKRACDEFLREKPERVSVLYAGDYAHGYFRKH